MHPLNATAFNHGCRSYLLVITPSCSAAGSPSARAMAVATDNCMHAGGCAALRLQDMVYNSDTLACLLSRLCADKECSKWQGLIRGISW